MKDRRKAIQAQIDKEREIRDRSPFRENTQGTCDRLSCGVDYSKPVSRQEIAISCAIFITVAVMLAFAISDFI